MENNSPTSQSLTPTQDKENYFSESAENETYSNTKIKLRQFWEKFYYFLRQVWPWISRLINFVVYEIIKVLKAVVRIALSQVGLMKN